MIASLVFFTFLVGFLLYLSISGWPADFRLLQNLLDMVWHYLILPVFNITVQAVLTVLHAFLYFIFTLLLKNKCEKKYMKTCKSYWVVAFQCVEWVNICNTSFCVSILNSKLRFFFIYCFIAFPKVQLFQAGLGNSSM